MQWLHSLLFIFFLYIFLCIYFSLYISIYFQSASESGSSSSTVSGEWLSRLLLLPFSPLLQSARLQWLTARPPDTNWPTPVETAVERHFLEKTQTQDRWGEKDEEKQERKNILRRRGVVVICDKWEYLLHRYLTFSSIVILEALFNLSILFQWKGTEIGGCHSSLDCANS